MQKLKEKILFLGLSPKKELITFIVLNVFLLLLSIFSFLLLSSIAYLIVLLLSSLLFSFVFITRYGKKIDQLNALNLEEFANLFSFFKIYIKNGFSVYTALKEICLFANESLSKLLNELILQIDEDKSIQPFITFAKHFNEIIVEEMMISIYQMIDDGENSDYLVQFELIFDKFSDLMYQKNLKAKESKLATLTSSSLIASCYLMIVMTIGIINIIGEMINGI